MRGAHARRVLTFLVLASLGVHLLLMGAFQLLLARGRRRRRALAPPDVLVSVLKPLAGHDDELDRNLDAFAALEGVRHEVLLGVASPDDPAAAAAHAFLRRHPQLDARIVLTDPAAAINPKVAQLVGLAAAARGEILVTSDSNVRVAPGYLADLVAPLRDPAVGLVTNLFAGTGERTLGAALENLQLAAQITPSVVLSTLGAPVTVGKSMAMRRDDLARLGGWAAFGSVLAEDLVLGRAVAAAGLRVVTSFATIENRNVDAPFARTFERHGRWAKIRRSLQPSFFLVEPFFSPVVMAGAAVLLSPSRTSAALLAVALVVQWLTAHASLVASRGHGMAWRYTFLEVLRPLVVLACWASACASRTIVWRGHPLVLRRGSVISPATSRASSPTPSLPRSPSAAAPGGAGWRWTAAR